MSMFEKATKKQAWLRLALEGPAGFGKTYTALAIGQRLTEGTELRVAVLDTEFGSASKYADLFDFDTVAMDPPFHPDRVVQGIREATTNGYGVFVVDSLSHFWTGEGGLLTVVDEIARTKYRGDSHRAWKDAGEIQQRLVDSILRTPIHVIACMRTKTEFVREEDEKGKTRIRKAGTKVVQRDEFDYEFDVIGRFDVPAVMAITKSRCADIPPETVFVRPGAEFADQLSAWLSSGEAAVLPAAPFSAEGIETPQTWAQVEELVSHFGAGVWTDFQGLMRAARDHDARFSNSSAFRQAAAGVAVALREEFEPDAVPFPTLEDLQRLWSHAVAGEILTPVFPEGDAAPPETPEDVTASVPAGEETVETDDVIPA